MNVSAINSVNFTARKPKEKNKQQKAIELSDKLEGTLAESSDIKSSGEVVASVGCAGGKNKQQKAIELFDKLEGTLVESGDIKSPGEIVASVGCAGGKTFIKGAGAALLLDKATGEKASAAFENGLRFISRQTGKISEKLITKDAKGIRKVGNFLGENLDKLHGFAKNTYKSMANSVSAENVVKHSAGKGMAVVAGLASALTMVPQILKKDGNNDGVSDISQKSQNVYAAKSAEIDKFSEGVNIVSEIVATLA